MAGDSSGVVLEGGSVGLADDGEELVEGVVGVDGDGFPAQTLKVDRSFGH